MFTINATHIGKRIDGIGRFSLYIAKYFFREHKVVINETAKTHFSKEELQKIQVVSKHLSPDYGRTAHLKRLVYSNTFKGKVFNLSQLEVSLWNKKQIVVVHDIIPFLFPENHKLQYPYYKLILPKVLKNRCRFIITVSKDTRNKLIKKFDIDPKIIEVIYNGIELPNIREPEEDKENFILFVGRNGPNKNISNLIKAFKLVKKNIPNLKLVIAGTRVKRQEGVVSLDYVEDEELNRLYRKAKLFVFPSYYEGFGLPVLEAMARGTAVVTSAVSSLPEVGGNAAIYIENPSNPKEIAEKILKVLKDNALRKELEFKALERAKTFSVHKMVKEYKQLLEVL